MKIAAQLYSVREFTQTEQDFAETIKKVAKIGYAGVQLSAHSPKISAEFIAETCKANNIVVASSHAPPARILNDTETLIAEHKLYNSPQIGLGMIPEEYRADLNGIKKFVADFLPAAQKIKAAGLNFAYHNHEYEFGKFDGKFIMDYIIEGFAQADLQVILDTFWVQAGGCNPVQWIEKLAGKLQKIHFKDMAIVDRQQRFAEIGRGNLDWKNIIAACKKSGVEWVIVEQDDSYGENPFDCLKISYDFLAANI
ncbi:MAG: sugar phosphate isomerase/epimerase [Defluviitaleaceae bacterium]|nr:sugar phosphate isomerase/epimerase [Defluviitaleaceae bacterium]